MPITSSAKKALKSSVKKRAMNQKRKVAVRETAKKVALGGAEELSRAYQAIDKAAKRGVIKKNTAARKKARLSRVAKAAKTAKKA